MFNFFKLFSCRQPCPYCGGRSVFSFTGRDWNQNAVPDSFDYYKCKECSLIFMRNLPADIKPFYVREQYDIPASADNFEPRANSQAWKLKLLTPFVTSGRLLEVGPATGEFATVARKAGYSPTLIEMDPACCRFLRDELKHEVIESGDPKNAIPQDRLFDAICVWQVIEHIPEFWKFLEAAGQRLRKGGVLAISTPNPDSMQARLLGGYWPHADVPRHLYLISPRWFERVCRAWGLRSVMVTTRDEGSIGLNYYGWFLWLRNRFGRFVGREVIDRWSAKTTEFFKRWETLEGRGCCYVFIMVKE